MRPRFYFLAMLAALAVSASAKEKGDSPKPDAAAALAAGQKAPSFSLDAFPGGRARLKDFQGKWLVLCFYPKANAPKDILQMNSIKGVWPQIQDLNASVLGVSMDPSAVVEKFQKDLALPFSLAVDSDKNASAAYGALGIGGLFSTRRAVFIDPQGRVADILERCPEKQYGARVVEKLKALQPNKPQ